MATVRIVDGGTNKGSWKDDDRAKENQSAAKGKG